MMNQPTAKRIAETQNDTVIAKRAKLDATENAQAPSDLSLLNIDDPIKRDESTNSTNENAQETGLSDNDQINEVTITEIVNAYIESLEMEKVPETPLYTKTAETGERIIFFEAGFLTIITSKGNRRQPINFSNINMVEFNKALDEAAVIMIPISYLYRHAKNPSLPSKLNHHEDHIGMIIYRKNEQGKFMYVDVHLNSETKSVGKDVRVKKVYSIAMQFIRKKLNLNGKYKSQKLSNPNPTPNEPYIPLLWIVEHILANPNEPFQDPSESTDIEEYKKNVKLTLKGKQDDSDEDKDNYSAHDLPFSAILN